MNEKLIYMSKHIVLAFIAIAFFAVVFGALLGYMCKSVADYVEQDKVVGCKIIELENGCCKTVTETVRYFDNRDDADNFMMEEVKGI